MTTRREFLKTLGAGSAAAAGLTACGGGGGSSSSSSGSTTTPPTPLTAPILVLVQIQGGLDWLSLMVPTSGNNATVYGSKRSTLKIPGSNLSDLGHSVGLNNDFTGMYKLHQAGRIAWIPGLGMPNPNLSHFTSTDIWGFGAAVPDGSGWLGRWGDHAWASNQRLDGIAVTSDLLKMLVGKTRSFVSIPSASSFYYPSFLGGYRITQDAALLQNAYVYGLTNGVTALAADAAAEGNLFYSASTSFNSLLQPRTPSVAYPGDKSYPTAGLSSQLSSQLKFVAQMIASGVPAQVYTVRLGGFDTHSNQAADMPKLLKALGGSLSAFYDDLATIDTTVNGGTVKAQDRVVMVGWSEFGRRINENNGGTDHGTAILSFALGNSVKGGFYGGGYPDLSKPDATGNMVYTADFRSLYATLLSRVLGYSDTTGILGSSYPTFGFI